ncbi:MAG: c-type cytochrome biosis protein CcsB [Actinomycetota bacterium]|jgi:cytochrome c-type biogenesis protein CcsB
MTVMLNEELSQISLLFVSAAMGFLAVALLLFAFQLAKLKEDSSQNRFEKFGFWLLGISTVVLGVGVMLRGIAANRVPWANMYEFSISGALMILIVYLMSLRVKDVRYIATFISGFVLITLFAAVSLFYVEVKTLMPALQSYWLVIHVVVAILATAFFAIAAGFHIFYLIKAAGWGKNLMDRFPDLRQLERIAYRFNMVGFVSWSFTLIAGAIWAERAWHRYWGWDTKEVWTFIIWVIYAGYLHAMATRGWTGNRAAWLGLIGFSAVIFNFTIVNLFFKGLHVYSGL